MFNCDLGFNIRGSLDFKNDGTKLERIKTHIRLIINYFRLTFVYN